MKYILTILAAASVLSACSTTQCPAGHSHSHGKAAGSSCCAKAKTDCCEKGKKKDACCEKH